MKHRAAKGAWRRRLDITDGPDFTAFTVGARSETGVVLTGCGRTLKSDAPATKRHTPLCLEQPKSTALFRVPLLPKCCR